jgi:hypothetical protein
MPKQTKLAASIQAAFITAEINEGIQATTRDIVALNQSSGEVGIMMLSAGITVDMLTPPTKSKPNPQFNEKLWKEVRFSIIGSPCISDELRKAWMRAEEKLAPESVHTRAFRDTAQEYVRHTLKAIRKGIQRAMEKGERGASKKQSLGEWLDGQLAACILKVQDGEGSANCQYPANAFPEALEALRTCRASLRALFK